MKKITKKFTATLVCSAFFCLLCFNTVYGANMRFLLESAGTGTDGAGFAAATGNTLAINLGSLVQYLLSFLGVIFIVLIIYGGFLWMTARGEDEQVTSAKDIIRNAIIGLLIVLTSNVIAVYVVDKF